jgi:hypothetical protein
METNNRGFSVSAVAILLSFAVIMLLMLILLSLRPYLSSKPAPTTSLVVAKPTVDFSEAQILWKTSLSSWSHVFLSEMGDGHDYLISFDRHAEIRTMVHAAGCRACNHGLDKPEKVEEINVDEIDASSK